MDNRHVAAAVLAALVSCQSSQSSSGGAGSATGSGANAAQYSKSSKAPVVATPGPITVIPPTDLAGYFSGNYRTPVDRPAMFADLDRQVFVMAGPRAIAELPMNQPEFAMTGFEAFLTLNGFAANGKKAVDPATATIKGEPLVATGSGSMPDALKSHFTPEQLTTLAATKPDDGYAIIAAKYPLIWVHDDEVDVVGPGHPLQAFALAKASDGFAAFRAMLPPK